MNIWCPIDNLRKGSHAEMETPSRGKHPGTHSSNHRYLDPGLRCFKVVVLGDSGVGKTCLAARLNKKDALIPHIPTIGLDFSVCTMVVDGERVRANIWDTAGQERFNSLLPAYCRSAQGAILVFDLTDLRTFLSLDDCLENASLTLPVNACKLVVGNKKDLADQGLRAVTSNMGEDFAKGIRADYIEISVLQDDDVTHILKDLARAIIRTFPDCSQPSNTAILRDRPESGKKFKCCS